MVCSFLSIILLYKKGFFFYCNCHISYIVICLKGKNKYGLKSMVCLREALKGIKERKVRSKKILYLLYPTHQFGGSHSNSLTLLIEKKTLLKTRIKVGNGNPFKHGILQGFRSWLLCSFFCQEEIPQVSYMRFQQ